MFLEWENNSGKFQNNAINDVKQISLSHVIKYETLDTPWNRVTLLSNWIIVKGRKEKLHCFLWATLL